MKEITYFYAKRMEKESEEIVEKYRWAALPGKFMEIMDKLFRQKDPSTILKPNIAK